MLGYSHPIEDTCTFHLTEQAGSCLYISLGDPSYCLNYFRSKSLHKLAHILKTFSAPPDKFLILKAISDDNMHQSVDKGNIRPWLVDKLGSGIFAKFRRARVSHNKLSSVKLDSSLNYCANNGMAFSSVRANNEEKSSLLKIRIRITHCPLTEGSDTPNDSGGMA